MSQSSSPRVHKIWYAFRLLPVALAVAAMLVSGVCGVAFAQEEEGSIVVDANSTPCIASNHHFTTIKDAVTFAAGHSGVTINVCPGTYAEQIELDTSVTLRGVTVSSANGGNGAGAAIITVPSGGLSVNATIFGSSTPNLEAQVLVHASNVTLSDLTIDGTGGLPSGTCSSNELAGVDFDSGSSGTARHLVVTNESQSKGNGAFCNVGGGIVVNKGAGDVTVRDSSISNYDGYGIGGLVPVDVENNVLRGVQGGIGIVVSTTDPEQSTISSNSVVVAANSLSGILFYPGLGTVSNNSVAVGPGGLGIGVVSFSSGESVISGNAVSGVGQNEEGIVAAGGSMMTVRNNNISAVGASGVGILVEGSGDTVEGNTINGAGTGITGVTGNTVNGNTYFNVGQLTKP